MYQSVIVPTIKYYLRNKMFLINLNILRKIIFHRIYKTPISIMIEPACVCNLKCFLCPTPHRYMTRKQGVMKYDTYQRFLDNVKNFALVFNFNFAGEPFLNPELFKMVKAASENKIYTLVDTNATLIDDNRIQEILDSNLNILIVNIDNIDPTKFEQFRKGANFETTITQIKKLCQAKRVQKKTLPIILAEVIVSQKNENDLEAIYNFAIKEIGVDLVWFKYICFPFNSKGFREETNFTDLIETYLPKKSKLKRYDYSNRKLKLINPSKKCRWERQSLVLWDGSVTSCCFDYNGDYVFGNVNERSFLEIWNSKKYSYYRKNLIKLKKMELCKYCSI